LTLIFKRQDQKIAAFGSSYMGLRRVENETSVMQLPALRPNVADLAACSTVAKTATIPCANQPFT
jgi:hypothetical protein